MRNPFAATPEPAPAAVISGALTQAKAFENEVQKERRLRADLIQENRIMDGMLAESKNREERQMEQARRFLSEMVEAQSMCGSGPWQPGDIDALAHASPVLREALHLQEAGPVGGGSAPLGAYGMYELLLQNVGWQREINYSRLEFSRWGIQQIILICRLYYLKNPICRRLVDVIAQYVFARGFDITTDDDDVNDVIKSIVQNNANTFGHVSLTAQQRSKITDGNLFWVYFTSEGTGECKERLIDATEIQEIWTDPDDSDVPQYYQRQWTQRVHDPVTGAQSTKSMMAWYPAINFDPSPKPTEIKGHPVMWKTPVYHRKLGTVGKWLFGCPPMYPMVDWAAESRHFLEVCMSVRQTLSQISAQVTTKGGQQAIEGWKQQVQTQVGPGSPAYDTNPEAVAGSTLVKGPGTTYAPVVVQGATFSPDDVRWYVIMCCMCLGMPPTFIGDMETSNLATATSLDRPTETVFLSIQEEWIEDMTIRMSYMLSRSINAPGGKLIESHKGARVVAAVRQIKETFAGNRYWGFREAKKPAPGKPADIEVRVQFPAIREGDIGVLIKAGVEAMTLDNKGGQIVGVDERAGNLWLMETLGFENASELIEKMYPSTGKDKYDPDRAKQKLAAPIMKLADQPGGTTPPTPAQAQKNVDDPPVPTKEAILAVTSRLNEAATKYLNGE